PSGPTGRWVRCSAHRAHPRASRRCSLRRPAELSAAGGVDLGIACLDGIEGLAGAPDDVLFGEVRDHPLEELIFPLQTPLIPTQLREFTFLRTGQPRIASVVVDVGLHHPPAQA